MRRTLVFAWGLIALQLAGVSPSAAGPGSLIAGVCTLDLEVTILTSGWWTLSTPVPGACETTDGTAEGNLDGEFGPFPAFSCANGVGDGHADLELGFDGGLTPSWTATDLEVTNVGGVIELAFFGLGSPHIGASGHFVQTAEQTQACLAGDTTIEWSGALVFEDP